MKPNESEAARYVAGFSLLLFCITLFVWFSEWYQLSHGAAGGDAGFAILGELIRLDLFCFGGILLSWLLALVATRSRFGVWLAILEAPFVLVAAGMVLRWFTA